MVALDEDVVERAPEIIFVEVLQFTKFSTLVLNCDLMMMMMMIYFYSIQRPALLLNSPGKVRYLDDWGFIHSASCT